jgi:tricorn protease
MTVHRHDLKSRKTDVAAGGVRFFEVSQSGEKMLTRQADNWFIRNLPPPPPPGGGPTPPAGGAPGGPNAAGSGQLNTANLELKIAPRDEWKQMFREAWRIERDYFYDPGYHGLNLRNAEERYAAFVEGIGSRADLNYLFAEMLGTWWSAISASAAASSRTSSVCRPVCSGATTRSRTDGTGSPASTTARTGIRW